MRRTRPRSKVGGMSTIAAPISVSQVESFQTVRPRLFGIAYRILGSAAEADEVVQDTWIRWHGTEKTEVHDPAAFLATVTTRLAINVSQSARGRRETPLGSWLPERIDEDADPAHGTERGEALEHAVQLLLEKLTPAERAVFVLREAFDYPYRRVSEVLGLSEPNTRQIASRARRRLAGAHRAAVDAVAQRRLLDAVVSAARGGHLAALEQVLVASLRDPRVEPRCPQTGDQGPDRWVVLMRPHRCDGTLPA
jgi:RNA polymerase sigma-70 factor, ECF subfamily